MSVFNVYFCGSGNYYGKASKKDKINKHINGSQLIQHVYDDDVSEEWVGKILLDGPSKILGCNVERNIDNALNFINNDRDKISNILENLLTKRHYNKFSIEAYKTANTYIPEKHASKRKKLMKISIKTLEEHYKFDYSTISPLIEKLNNRPSITTVNILGFSRGGVSCFLLANILKNNNSSIKVNIIALDPVPGGTHQFNRGKFATMNYKELKSNVNEYLGIYARDEFKKGFSALIPDLSKVKSHYITDMPGRHGTIGTGRIDKIGENNNKLSLLYIPFIVTDLVKGTMAKNGTKFKSFTKLPKLQVSVLFDNMNPLDLYTKKGKSKTSSNFFGRFLFGRRETTSRMKAYIAKNRTTFKYDFSANYKSTHYVCKYHEDMAEGNQIL